jgi:hypothetical protein
VSTARLAWGIGLVVLGTLCFLAAIGFTPMEAPLVTVAILVLLVGGGNLLSGRGGSRRRPPETEAPR